MSAAERPAVIRIRKGRSSDTQLHTAPNSRGPQSEAVRGSARCARSGRRRDGCGQSVGAGCRPVRVERRRARAATRRAGSAPSRPRRPSTACRARSSRPCRTRRPAGTSTPGTARRAATGRCTSSTRASAPRPRARASATPPGSGRRRPLPTRSVGAAHADRPRRGRPAHRRARQHPRRRRAARRHAEAPRPARRAVHRRRAQWYAAVADASGSAQEDVAAAFADDAYSVIASGRLAPHRRRQGGLARCPSSGAAADTAQVDRLGLRQEARTGAPSTARPGSTASGCPRPTRSSAPTPATTATTTSPSRPASPKITNIVIHNTEATYDTTLKLVHRPDVPVVALHACAAPTATSPSTSTPQDVGWHAGNWYVNSHSIGLEHEGFARQGAEWFSEPMYRSSARLVRYLADEVRHPARHAAHLRPRPDPGHRRPATSPACTGTRAPTGTGSTTSSCSARRCSAHTVRCGRGPRADPARLRGQRAAGDRTARRRGVACGSQGDELRLPAHRSRPRRRRSSTTSAARPTARRRRRTSSDIGARAQAGLTFAVAERQGDWTAIWFNGVKGWFLNPASDPTAVPVKGSYVVPKAGLAKAPGLRSGLPRGVGLPGGHPGAGARAAAVLLRGGPAVCRR